MISWLERNYIVSWIIVILLGWFIFYMSSLSFIGVANIGSGIKAEIYHIGIFFLFGFFLIVAISRGKSKGMILFAFVLAVLYGVIDEFHQSFVVGRVSGMFDVFLDGIGVVFASLVYLISFVYRRQNR